MNHRMIVSLLGRLLLTEALVMIPAVGIAFYHQEQTTMHAWLITIVLLLLVGTVLASFRSKARVFLARDGFVVVALGWVVLSLFGALPFYLSGWIPKYIDAFFETVSGFTTTGASILTNIEALPMCLLYWRSFTHWVGGMGVLVFLLAVVPMGRGQGDSMHLMQAESPGPQVGKLVPKVHQTAKLLYGIYILMTAVELGILLGLQMPFFDAITTTFGTAGTGGFAVKNDSLASYSAAIQNCVTVFMVLFGVNFNVFFLLMIGAFKRALANRELRLYLGIYFASVAAITLDTLHLFANAGQSLHHAAFQVASIMSTTGFVTTNFDQWPQFSRVLLVMLMVPGACAASTGGGIKIARVSILIQAVKNGLMRLTHPNRVRLVRLEEERLDDATVNITFCFVVLYASIAAASILLLSLDEFTLETNLTAVVACLSNVGPGLGTVGPIGNYAGFSFLSKVILCANMLVGRLEIFPFLVLVNPATWKK